MSLTLQNTGVTAQKTAEQILQVDASSQDMSDVNVFAKLIKSADEAARGAL
jgi:hypothetical protein